MNRHSYISLFVCIAMLFTHIACNNSQDLEPTEGFCGTFSLTIDSIKIETDFVTRAPQQWDTNSFLFSLVDPRGIYLFKGKKYSELTADDYTLPQENGYRILAETCTQEEALSNHEGWGEARVVGEVLFDVVANQHTNVSIQTQMENAGLEISFSTEFLDKFPSYAVTIQDARALVFDANNLGKIAYYTLSDTNHSLTLNITGSAGGWSDRINLTRQVELHKGRITHLNISYQSAQ